MNITDVPISGVYVQEGAVFQIVAQMIDYATGLPIPLQAATGFSISVLYPDGVTSQTFTAKLYTDGSDGMIVYTTRNSGSTVDLSQVGLYHFQANAVIGGVNLPPSFEDDFYVLPNVTGTGSPAPIYNSSVIIFYDSNNVRWAQGVDPSGLTSPVPMPTGPASFLQFNNLVMKDTSGIYWTVTISTSGGIVTTAGGSAANAVTELILNDINGRSWVLTISEAGQLQAA